MGAAQGIITAACFFWLAAVLVATAKTFGLLAGLSWGWIFAAAVPGLIVIAVFAAAVWSIHAVGKGG
jgi:hypothetical protein